MGAVEKPEHSLPPAAELWQVKAELFQIKCILADPSKVKFAGHRDKNISTLTELGITVESMHQFLRELTPKNYLSGPSDDRNSGDKKCIWEFGVDINEKPVYIKLKRVTEELIIISFHIAERELCYRFRK